MIVIGLLLGALGVSDIVRASTRGLGWAVSAGSALFVIASLAIHLPLWWVWSLGAIAAITAWLLLTRGGVGAGQRRAAKGAVLGLGAVIVALWLASGAVATNDVAPFEWFGAPAPALFLAYSPSTMLIVAGISVFLVESGNVVVRIALSSTAITDQTGEVEGDDIESLRRFLLLGEMDSGGLKRGGLNDNELKGSELKGGRLIGPFERLFIFALALAGQFTAIGAIVAAKGIIRFPEISRNDTNGSKAEEFLVGSFASWSLVLASVLIVIATLA